MSGPETSETDSNDGSHSGSSDADDEVPKIDIVKMNRRQTLKKQQTMKEIKLIHHETKLMTDNMTGEEFKQVLRLNEDMVDLKTGNKAEPIDDLTKMKIFQKAVIKVRAVNTLSQNQDSDSKNSSQTRRNRTTFLEGDLKDIEKLRSDHQMEEERLEREHQLKLSGWGKFFTNDLSNCHHEDFDPGVNAMALLCGLVLSIPYTVVENINYDHLDWLKASLAACPRQRDYNFVYNIYRATYTCTVYFSISGMIIATFYFLFKRNDDEDYRTWRDKARWMVFFLFITTALAIISLVFLTNIFFEYFLINTETNICDAGTAPYTYFGMTLGGIAFFGAMYLIL